MQSDSPNSKIRTILGGLATEKSVPPADRSLLYFDNERILDFFSVVRGLRPCVPMAKVEAGCFFAEVG